MTSDRPTPTSNCLKRNDSGLKQYIATFCCYGALSINMLTSTRENYQHSLRSLSPEFCESYHPIPLRRTNRHKRRTLPVTRYRRAGGAIITKQVLRAIEPG